MAVAIHLDPIHARASHPPDILGFYWVDIVLAFAFFILPFLVAILASKGWRYRLLLLLLIGMQLSFSYLFAVIRTMGLTDDGDWPRELLSGSFEFMSQLLIWSFLSFALGLFLLFCFHIILKKNNAQNQ